MVGKKFPIKESTGTIVPYNYQKIPNEGELEGGHKVLAKYIGNKDVLLTLPSALKTSELAWLSIWCRKYKSDRGHVIFHNTGILKYLFSF